MTALVSYSVSIVITATGCVLSGQNEEIIAVATRSRPTSLSEGKADFSGATSPVYDRALNAWIITDSRHCRELLRSDHLTQPQYISKYEELAARLGLDFAQICFALRHIPLCLDGSRHAQARRALASIIATNHATLGQAAPLLVERYFGELRSAGRYDLMRTAVEPLVDTLISTLVGIPAEIVGRFQNLGQVFDMSIGVSKRRQLELRLSNARAEIEASLGGQASPDDVGYRLALIILGRDALVGTIGESLHVLIADEGGLGPVDGIASGRSWSTIEFPAQPPRTGVTHIERVVTQTLEFESCVLNAGDRVRLYLQADEGVTGHALFGTGAHACLGQPRAMDLWREICSFLAALPSLVSVVEYRPRTSDYVFSHPEVLVVEIQ